VDVGRLLALIVILIEVRAHLDECAVGAHHDLHQIVDRDSDVGGKEEQVGLDENADEDLPDEMSVDRRGWVCVYLQFSS
jgi:hypothetical protein